MAKTNAESVSLLLLMLVGVAAALQIQTSTIQYVELNFFEKREGHIVFEIEFDSQPYFKDFKNDQFRSYADYKTFNFAEGFMLTAFLDCPKTFQNPCSENGTDNTVGIVTLPPSASPVQSVMKALSEALISQFSGLKNEFNWTLSDANFPAIVTRNNTFTGIAKLWEQDSKTQQYKVCVPTDLLASCPLYVVPPMEIPNENFNTSGICDSTGNNCLNFTLVPYSIKPPQCDAISFASARTSFLDALNFNPISVNNVGQLIINALEYEMRIYDSAILGCRDLTVSLVTFGEETTTSFTDICHRKLFDNGVLNQQYLADPCCNDWAGYYFCCDKRDVTYSRENIQTILVDKVATTCSNPAAAAGSLLDIHNVIENIDELCGAEQGWGNSNEWFTEIFGPLELCLKEVFDKSCNANQDCVSDLCINGKCVPPYENPTPLLVDCLASNLDPITIRFWKNQWGLNINSTKSEFTAEFRNQLFEDTCVGPINYDAPPENETACLSVQKCNWNPNLDQTQCLAPTDPNFCGLCISPHLCWSVTIPALCVIPGNATDCADVWNPDFKVCINSTADQMTCNGFWFDGFYNTLGKCDEGLCVGADFGTPASQCSTKNYCTRPCPACSSTAFPSGACLGVSTLPDCLTNGGSFHLGICRYGTTNQTECTILGGQWSTCQERNLVGCYAGPRSEILGCYVDTSAACPSETECQLQGECNDVLLTSNSDKNAACIRPYFVDWNGAATCNFNGVDNSADSGWYDVKIGCLNPNIDEVQCKIANYIWSQRSRDQTTCENPKICREPGRNSFTYKNETECVSCGGTFESIFHWTSGIWEQAHLVNLTYDTRQYTSTNTWVKGLSWSQGSFKKILNILLQPLGTKMGYRAKTSGYCKFSAYLFALQRIADNCGSSNIKRDLLLLGDSVLIGEFKGWSNLKQLFDAGVVSVEFNEFSLTSSDFTDISINRYPASILLTSSGGKRTPWQQALEKEESQKRGVSQTSALSLDIPVQNGNSIEIGQVISDGYDVAFLPAINGNFSLCVAKRSDASPRTCYTVTDFASGNPLRPLDTTITYEDADTVCATFTSSPTVLYAVKRIPSWSTATIDPCPAPITTGATTGNGQASSSSVIQISAIVLFLATIILSLF